MCVLCGQASGNLETIDFDVGGELFSAWWDRIPVGLRDRLVIETTQSGGRHVVYRCEVAVCGNLKLAQRKDGDTVVTLIETRGEGGLFLCAPTTGKDWPRKINVRILHEIGQAECIGERFASGEGIQDSLFIHPCTLFQTDEIDGIL